MVIEDRKLDGKYIIDKCPACDIEVNTLMNCSASGFDFIDKNFVRQDNLILHKLKVLQTVEVIDGRPIKSGDIEHLV